MENTQANHPSSRGGKRILLVTPPVETLARSAVSLSLSLSWIKLGEGAKGGSVRRQRARARANHDLCGNDAGTYGPGRIIVAITMAHETQYSRYRLRFRIMCHK